MFFFQDFWRKSPCLFYGIFFLLGVLLYLHFEIYYLFALLLVIPCYKRFMLGLIIAIGAYFYAGCQYRDVFIFQDSQPGKGHFQISGITPYRFFSKTGYVCKGKFLSFMGEKQTYHNIPCSIFFENRTPLDQDYLCVGTLSKKDTHKFLFKNEIAPIACKERTSLLEKRAYIKGKIRKILKDNLKNKEVFLFFNALITGENNDTFFRYCFSRLGLSHVMAISGFHFSLILAFISFLVVLPTRIKPICLLIFASLYYFYIGDGPSIFRAYLMTSIFLLGKILGRKGHGLNYLGLVLLIECVLDPYVVFNLGFILSYFCCGSLLIFHPIFERLFKKIFSRPSIDGIGWVKKAPAILSLYLQNALNISLSVSIAIVPVLLYLFGSFPYLSLIYNLFFPFITMLSMIMIIICLILSPVPFVSNMLFSITNTFTSWVLQSILHPPIYLEFHLREEISFAFLGFYLSLVFGLGIFCKGFFTKIDEKFSIE